MKRASKNKKVKASSSSTRDDAGPQSLFVMVSYKCNPPSPYFSSILQLETKANNYEYVAHFKHPQGHPPIRWVFSPLATSPEDLCLAPHWGRRDYRGHAPLHGCIYNLRTHDCKSIRVPGGPELFRNVVALGVHIYFMGTPLFQYGIPEAVFTRYNRLTDVWEPLRPFPYKDANENRYDGRVALVVACAVWDGTILLNMDGCGMWVYDVNDNRWYPVLDEGELCDYIVGKAVVLDNIIYFLGNVEDLVVALSVNKEVINGDVVFICSLCSKIMVPGMDEIKFQKKKSWWRTRDLVFLGNNNFCIVRSCNYYESIEYQPIQLTNIMLKGGKMNVTGTCVHEIKLMQNQQFEVQLCFSLPTTWIKKHSRIIVNYNPFFDDIDPNRAQELLEEVEEEEEQELDEELGRGHSVYVRKLSAHATVRQLEKGLKKFGPINRIRLEKNNKGKPYAIVEFENATSKQTAIEASTVRIGDRSAEILETREESASVKLHVKQFDSEVS